MTTTECCYVQVEKEALAITWSCKKFSSYVHRKKFAIEMGHKPLIAYKVTKACIVSLLESCVFVFN